MEMLGIAWESNDQVAMRGLDPVREVIDEVIHIRQQIKEEVVSREKEDNTLLDTMLYAQQRLQEAILRSFGASAEDANAP